MLRLRLFTPIIITGGFETSSYFLPVSLGKINFCQYFTRIFIRIFSSAIRLSVLLEFLSEFLPVPLAYQVGYFFFPTIRHKNCQNSYGKGFLKEAVAINCL